MAEIKRYLDLAGTQELVDNVKAADEAVLQASKDYSDSLAKNYDGAGSAATAESNAKAYTDQVAATLETKGEAAKVQGNLDTEVQARKDADAVLQGAIDGVSAIANKNKEDIAAINNETTGILAQAQADATSKANAVQANVDALNEKVGELPEGTTATDVIDYVNIKTAGIATDAALGELQNQLSGVQGEVVTIKGDYLKSSDKEELEGKIALKADQTALDEVAGVANAAATKVELKAEEDRAKGEEARIEGLISAEADRAKGVEADFESRIATMEVFWDTTEDKDGVVNKLKEIKEYIESDETGAATMAGNIQANTQAISAMDEAYKAADATLQGNIDTLTGVVNGKAAQSDLEALAGRVTTAEGDIEAVEGRVDTLEGEVDALQALFGDGDGSVADMIDEAVAAEAELRVAGDEASVATAAADATAKANKALEDAKKYADDEDAKIESRVDALEGATHTHANKALLDTYTQTEADLADAVAKKHEHANKAELDKIADGDVAKWNATEKNAKDYADGLNNAMTSKVDGVDARVKTLEETIVDKADSDDLDAAVLRIAANESAIAANTSAIASFSPIPTTDIAAMFA